MLAMEDRDFERIVSFVRSNYGINLAKKRALVQGRLALDIERRGYDSFRRFFDEVISKPGGPECQRMIDQISTNHTFFFREDGCFSHLRGIAVPALIERGVTDIRIWCAASSSGQECYSIAMVMEQALFLHRNVRYHILASDINSQVLEKARQGVYPVAELANIPEHYRKIYCRRSDGQHFKVADELGANITWKQINLVKPLPIEPVQHLIFCRNVMIYFDAPAKEALTAQLYRLTAEGGFVYVGSTETLDMKRARFRYIAPSVFEKRSAET